jgi:hypothetical protein
MDNLSNDIIKYKKGELSPEQMHALEKKALNDHFLAEALEGVEEISSETLAIDVSAINENVARKKNTILFSPLRIAAGIILIAVSTFLIYQFVPTTKTIAYKTEKLKPENKKTDGEKVGDVNQPNASNEKKNEDNTKVQAEKRKLKVESETQELDKLRSAAKSESPPTPKADQAETQSQNSESKTKEVIQETPVKGLAASEPQQVKIGISEDQNLKGIAEQEAKAAGSKSISPGRKKDLFGASQAQRSSMPSGKIQQIKSISGQVISAEDGSPLPGVNVIIKGTLVSTVTDSKGD